jgi:hypothetical protein
VARERAGDHAGNDAGCKLHPAIIAAPHEPCTAAQICLISRSPGPVGHSCAVRWLRRAWTWMWQPTQPTPPRANARCPLCDRPVVAGGPTTYRSRSGIMFAPRTRQELIAACPAHGHRSVNDLTSDADTSGST